MNLAERFLLLDLALFFAYNSLAFSVISKSKIMASELIYDVGMNNGDDTAYYLHQGFKVLAIEADPMLCSKASVRFKNEIQEERLTILNIGVAPVQGTLDFWICDGHSEWSSFLRSIASRDGLPHHSIKVECQTFSWILEKFGVPYYLKIDIEGLINRSEVPKYVSCEIGDIENYLLTLDALGFSKYKLISQYNFLPLEMPPSKEQRNYEFWNRLATSRNLFVTALRKGLRVLKNESRITNMRDRLRRDAEWTFPLGSSGPFGEELPGHWHSSQEAFYIYTSFRDLFKKGVETPFWTGKDYFWVDLHACREG